MGCLSLTLCQLLRLLVGQQRSEMSWPGRKPMKTCKLKPWLRSRRDDDTNDQKLKASFKKAVKK